MIGAHVKLITGGFDQCLRGRDAGAGRCLTNSGREAGRARQCSSHSFECWGECEQKCVCACSLRMLLSVFSSHPTPVGLLKLVIKVFFCTFMYYIYTFGEGGGRGQILFVNNCLLVALLVLGYFTMVTLFSFTTPYLAKVLDELEPIWFLYLN